ncbi:hypothetical protein B0A55_00875 [Friedmanniomyces simplex]|uniref:Uncharacterized protein n=1 Tax=Friedmanniomyces simplex TaxID=329884 RepID=A0A4U0XZ71_9PEZI|nr:hypothetical protein B0A55_00875 [Friedmanniomyces simplex]
MSTGSATSGSTNTTNNQGVKMILRMVRRQALLGPGHALAPYSPETSPARRPRSGRQPSYQEAHDEPTDPYFDDVREEAYDKRHQSTRPSRTESDNEDMLSVLRRTVEHCQTQVKRSRKDLERASRQQTVDIGFLQALLDQVRARERALATAEQDLRADEDRLGRASNQGQQHHHRRLPRRHRAPPTPPDDDDEAFAALRFGRLPGHAGPVDPLFADFDDLHGADPFAYAFGSFSSPFGSFAGSSQFGDDINQLFGMPSGPQFAGPRSKRPRFSSANSGPRPQAHPGFAAFTPAPPTGPPPTSMLPEEAKRLFRTYNDRWNALLPTDPNIPYPARGLQACALLDPNTIWAPMVISPPATWSEEAIMQANAQAFYLCVVDLIPQYTEAGGKVSMGYNRTGATPAQVKQLVDLLKKEKTRWHSDRLGRRNNGMPGPNEALQGDPRARAVFHGVCELMEIAQ